MEFNKIFHDAIIETVLKLKEGEYEAAGGTLFYLYENIDDELSKPEIRKQAVAVINDAVSLILGEDPYDAGEMNVYKLSKSEIEETIKRLEELLTIIG